MPLHPSDSTKVNFNKTVSSHLFSVWTYERSFSISERYKKRKKKVVVTYAIINTAIDINCTIKCHSTYRIDARRKTKTFKKKNNNKVILLMDEQAVVKYLFRITVLSRIHFYLIFHLKLSYQFFFKNQFSQRGEQNLAGVFFLTTRVIK